jgi:hypothetical protein
LVTQRISIFPKQEKKNQRETYTKKSQEVRKENSKNNIKQERFNDTTQIINKERRKDRKEIRKESSTVRNINENKKERANENRKAARVRNLTVSFPGNPIQNQKRSADCLYPESNSVSTSALLRTYSITAAPTGHVISYESFTSYTYCVYYSIETSFLCLL